MNQVLIGIFLSRQRLSLSAIDEKCIAIPRVDAIACSTVEKHVREMRWMAGKD
jgi:hypothetical protein